ncbi:DUF4056 domain-containing protein [Bradyrhizobium japonicum]|uniref:DUF4056 domain-containing protein n=1 Tax=Bradyrhizobium japonicum TaxID=375 RepID=UPI002714E182|nr:DUF4056 domain-containing protein [Bradyrhizobium japonicum]WLB58025.1 DUF4056 domain-containing protein [Bradyrhizobium japonicum]WLB60108.1 DUF4056 domain-containing protein [Bradyrhizobium japonicum]
MPARKGPLLIPLSMLGARPYLVVDYLPFDGLALTLSQRKQIGRAVRFLAAQLRGNSAPVRVRLVGHTDSTGAIAHNLALGRKRAEAVRGAFLASILRQAPWLAPRITFDVLSRGEAEPIASNRTPGGRGRNRRVVVFLDIQGSSAADLPQVRALGPSGGPTRPPSARTCCILAPTTSPRTANNNLLEPSNLGVHRGASETTGLIYHPQYGFLDLGHIRDHCDLTYFLYAHIANSGGKTGTVKTVNSTATITKPVPPEMWVLVARSIAYDDGLGHEIHSYANRLVPGMHNSSFSPEDLPSNFIGTRVGENALRRGGDFSAAVTASLQNLLFGAAALKDTRQAFDNINGCWVSFTDPRSLLDADYLLRRNFTRVPWKAPRVRNAIPSSWMFEDLTPAAAFYDFIYNEGRRIPKSTFTAEFANIRQDAAKRYGASYDQWGPCSVGP